MNKKGHVETLRPSQPGNRNAVRHGVFSPRSLEPRAREIAEGLLAAEHTVPLDRIAAEEIGALVAMAEAIDADLLDRGLTNRAGEARSLLDLRIRLSGRLQRWLGEFGATPASRVAWVEAISRGEAMANLVRDEVTEGMRLLEEARRREPSPPAKDG